MLVIAALLAGASTPAHAAFPGTNGAISFSSGGDIVSMPLGGSWTRLTSDPADDAQSAWSPDGKRIAFRSRRDGRYEVYVANADGSGQQRLTTTPSPGTFSSQPSWSPDGKRMLFRSNRNGGPDADVYVMNADGTDVRRVAARLGDDRYPSFSPDGNRILFRNDVDGDTEIYTMATDGGDLRRLTNNELFDGGPSWSPDGTRIAFERGPGTGSEAGGAADVWIMKADGSEARRLTTDTAHDEGAIWSPDGTKIVFTSERSGNSDIWVMGADGSGQIAVTSAPTREESPDWQPVPAPPPITPPVTTPPKPVAVTCGPRVGTAIRLGSLAGRGLRITLRCPAPVTMTAELVLTGAQARRAGMGTGRSVRLARVTRQVRAGAATIRVRPSATMMRRLRRVAPRTLRRLRPLLTITTRGADKPPAEVYRQIRLTR